MLNIKQCMACGYAGLARRYQSLRCHDHAGQEAWFSGTITDEDGGAEACGFNASFISV